MKGVGGVWKDLTDNVNLMAAQNAPKITVDVHGEILELKNTINTMVDQLNAFASEVTRVAREVGTEGKLGGQAQVPGSPASGRTSPTTSTRWPANLTGQVRNIAEVTTAVANGDLSKKITVDVKGEILELKRPSTPWSTSSCVRGRGDPRGA